MCVTYCSLNSVTRTFEYPLPRSIESIEELGYSIGPIYFTSLDTRSSYHKIKVYIVVIKKSCLLRSQRYKTTFLFIPFRPKNAISHYTSIIKIFRKDLNTFFSQIHIISPPSVPSKLIFPSKIIIDDIFYILTT